MTTHNCVFGDQCPYPHTHDTPPEPPSDEAIFRRAADKISELYEATRHIPLPLEHSKSVRGQVNAPSHVKPLVAQAFWGGLADVLCTLHPGTLPLLAAVLNDAANSAWAPATPDRNNLKALALAILGETPG